MALVEDVAKGDVHAALGRKAHAGLLADLVKVSAVIEKELGDAVVVGDEEVWMSGAAQIRGSGSKRPASDS